jgi:hypothetical protein
MNRRTLTTMALVSLTVVFAAALPQIGFAQSNPFDSLVGTWKLNLAKSAYSPGPAPRSSTLTFQKDGQGLRVTAEGVDAQGNTAKRVNVVFDDGRSHPISGAPAYDAVSLKTVNDLTM